MPLHPWPAEAEGERRDPARRVARVPSAAGEPGAQADLGELRAGKRAHMDICLLGSRLTSTGALP